MLTFFNRLLLAYRVKDRLKTAQFFIDGFGYKIDTELRDGFVVDFGEGKLPNVLY